MQNNPPWPSRAGDDYSLKSWINIPVAIKPYVKRTGTGFKEFGEKYKYHVLCRRQGTADKKIRTVKKLFRISSCI